VWNGADRATAGSFPGTRPRAGNDPHDDSYADRKHGVQEESIAIRARVLSGLSEQVREDTAAQGTDFADRAARDGGGKGPAKRNELEGRTISPD
jgi:hypothetical protein